MEIEIRDMSKKELAQICGCTAFVLRKRLKAFSVTKVAKDAKFTYEGKEKMIKKNVRLFLVHNDIIPEKINV